MANAVYPKWKEALLGAAANSALTGTGTTGLYAVLVDTGVYTYSASHTYYSSLSGIAGVEREITSVTMTDGIVDGSDVLYTAVAPGPTLEAIILLERIPAQARHGG